MSLSHRALAIAAAIILLAIAGIWSGEPFEGFWRWPAVLLLLFISWERLKLPQKIDIRRMLEKPLSLGETGSYALTVSNRSDRPLILETQADYPAALEGDKPLQRWHLKPGETQSRHIDFVPVELGTMPLGSLYLRILGSFGLCWWSRRSEDQVSVSVQPALLHPGANTTPTGNIGLRRSRFKAGDGFELLELRDYRHGDALHSIDWKATARRGKPVVRRFEREQRLEIAVLIDCGRASRIHAGRLDRLHEYVNIAARLAEFAVRLDDRIACLAYAQRPVASVAMAGGASAVQNIRSLLSSLTASAEESNALGAALQVRQLIKRRGLVVFLTEIEQPEAAAQLIQAVQLLTAKHQVLIAALEDPAVAETPKQPVGNWQDPYRQFAALEYLRGRELTKHKLQRSGIAVISATAQHLDTRVLEYYQRQRSRISG